MEFQQGKGTTSIGPASPQIGASLGCSRGESIFVKRDKPQASEPQSLPSFLRQDTQLLISTETEDKVFISPMEMVSSCTKSLLGQLLFLTEKVLNLGFAFDSHMMASCRREMKVIVGGMPRTGTVSITSALEILGLKPYDYFVRLNHGHLPWWNEKLKAKYRDGTVTLDRRVLDRMMGDFDCISDAPCFFLVEELAQAFPEAKILLNERDIDSWFTSMEKTIIPSYKADKKMRHVITRLLDPTYTKPIMDCDELTAAVLCDSDYSEEEKMFKRFVAHYKSFEHHPKGRVLKYSVQEQWKPLCKFLELPVPGSAFPNENNTKSLLASGILSTRQGYLNALRNVVVTVAIAIAVMFVFQN